MRYRNRLMLPLCILFVLMPVNLLAEGFMRGLWDEHAFLYQKIITMPFNRGVFDGSLDESLFRDYIVQDYHYLPNYKEVYGILLSKAPDEAGASFVSAMIKNNARKLEYMF